MPLSNSDPAIPSAQSTNLHLSSKDKRLIADIHSTYSNSGNISGGGGGLQNESTTSWESFVQPAKILPKNSSSTDVNTMTLGVKELHLEPSRQGSPLAERRGGGPGDASRLVASGGRRALIRADMIVPPSRRQGRLPSYETCVESPCGVPAPALLPTVDKPNGSNVAGTCACMCV